VPSAFGQDEAVDEEVEDPRVSFEAQDALIEVWPGTGPIGTWEETLVVVHPEVQKDTAWSENRSFPQDGPPLVLSLFINHYDIMIPISSYIYHKP